MPTRRPYSWKKKAVVGFVLFVVGLSLSFSPPSDCIFLPSMMTWAPCPHGVRSRGKKFLLQLKLRIEVPHGEMLRRLDIPTDFPADESDTRLQVDQERSPDMHNQCQWEVSNRWKQKLKQQPRKKTQSRNPLMLLRKGLDGLSSVALGQPALGNFEQALLLTG